VEDHYVPNDVTYAIHMSLGAVFSICPCTADQSAKQFEKASFHRPSESSPP